MYIVKNENDQVFGKTRTEPGYGFLDTEKPRQFKSEKEAVSCAKLMQRRVGGTVRVEKLAS